jgi:hypothetical protein
MKITAKKATAKKYKKLTPTKKLAYRKTAPEK